ncbi:MAG: PRC-barrel domain-containing protein [Chloroflexi bacterium]|nr:PRC-barrel domain-containing protein [Chloroflexota bacterium]
MDFPVLNGDGHRWVDVAGLKPYQLDALDLAKGMSVEASNGNIGVVNEVMYDATSGRVTHFLVKEGEGLKRDALVPVEWIALLDQDRVLLAVRREQVEEYADRLSDYSDC